MDFKEALRQVYEDGKYYSMDRSKLKAELDMLDSHEINNPSHVQRNVGYSCCNLIHLPTHKSRLFGSYCLWLILPSVLSPV